MQSILYPTDLRERLQAAAATRMPSAMRISLIDQLTDEAVRRGLARPRDCTKLLDAGKLS